MFVSSTDFDDDSIGEVGQGLAREMLVERRGERRMLRRVRLSFVAIGHVGSREEFHLQC